MKITNRFYYIVGIVLGLVLTPFAIGQAYCTRGYFAIGGEWLVVPLMLVLVKLVLEIKEVLSAATDNTKQCN